MRFPGCRSKKKKKTELRKLADHQAGTYLRAHHPATEIISGMQEMQDGKVRLAFGECLRKRAKTRVKWKERPHPPRPASFSSY